MTDIRGCQRWLTRHRHNRFVGDDHGWFWVVAYFSGRIFGDWIDYGERPMTLIKLWAGVWTITLAVASIRWIVYYVIHFHDSYKCSPHSFFAWLVVWLLLVGAFLLSGWDLGESAATALLTILVMDFGLAILERGRGWG